MTIEWLEEVGDRLYEQVKKQKKELAQKDKCIGELEKLLSDNKDFLWGLFYFEHDSIEKIKRQVKAQAQQIERALR